MALVGRTGSGKSTLAMLLLGLYRPTEGEILYDGVPLEHLNYRMLRSQFGVVLQESAVFSGSIRQNIAFNSPALPLEQVMEAARLAAIHNDILRMPMGYETWVAEGGAGLSGGQLQRLCLACTRVVIAHRLSTIRNADLILVLYDGEIVERGFHDELLARGGYYAQLVYSQLLPEAVTAPSVEVILAMDTS